MTNNQSSIRVKEDIIACTIFLFFSGLIFFGFCFEEV